MIDWILTGLAALALLAGLHPLNLFYLSWFSFLPLFLIFFRSGSVRKTVLHAAVASLLYYGIGLAWLLHYQVLAYAAVWLILTAAIPLFFLLFGRAAGQFRIPSLKILAAPAAWFFVDQIYALTPVKRIGIEVPFYGPLAFFQMASPAFGLSLLTTCILGLNAAAASFITERSVRALRWTVVFLALLAGLYVSGKNKLNESTGPGKINLALIQHNLPVSGKWRLEHSEEVRSAYRELALEAAKMKPGLIVFPLYTFPDDILRQPQFFTALARETGTAILVASHIPKEPGGNILEGYTSTAVFFTAQGEMGAAYSATQRAPFGPSEEATGEEYKIMETPVGKIGVLLCFEDSFPEIAQKAVQQGADFLIALSNPGFFSATSMPHYHLMQDRLRAIETRRPLARVSANGYSAIVDSRGRWLRKSELNKEEIILGTIGAVDLS